MNNPLVALVTGANKGIGLQIAKDLVARGVTVLLGSRDLERGEAAAKSISTNLPSAAQPERSASAPGSPTASSAQPERSASAPGSPPPQRIGSVRAIQLDVTNADSIAAAAERIRREFGRLDILINNAGISQSGTWNHESFEQKVAAGRPSVAPLSEVRAIFETNVFGLIAVTQAMLPLLREAPAGRIVNVSSEVGSLTLQTDPKNPYRIPSASYVPSKTAVNAITVAFANELEKTRIKVNAACPGFTATDLNNFRGTRSVEQAAREPVRLALLDDDGPTGTFSNEFGPLPW
ncbi:MAG TPA: SDR family oxidoreductase [Polyangiaceae bacterium]|nr:SDR family oxidoreductase [Polyangiaceae bacterium]